jgi:predicted lipoprotein with Yx(FWY)xxD motif
VSRVGSLIVVAAAAAVAVALVVLLTQSSSSQGGGPGAGSAAAPPAPDVRVGHGKLGPMLVDAHGHTLYLFLEDRRGHSSCTGRCAKVWPPLVDTHEGRPQAGTGVHRALLGTTRRPDEARQVVYHGHPLYRMSADQRPGDMVGQGFLGTWFAVSPAGHRLGKAGAAPEGY